MKTNVVVAVAMVMGLVTMGVAWAAEVEEKEEKSVISFGAFDLGDGKTVLMVSENKLGQPGCIKPYMPCGLRHHCCHGLRCNGYLDGRCLRAPGCKTKIGDGCALLSPCCYPAVCTHPTNKGKCVFPTPSALNASALNSSILRHDDSPLIEQVV